MKRELPSRPSLEFLRKEAKQLLDLFRRGDTDAVERLSAVTTSGKPSLHHAQLALAREYGSASWRDLVYRVRTAETDGFLKVVCGDRWDPVAARRLPPEHVRMGNIHVAAACGDIDAIEHLIAKDKGLAKQKGGPDKASPLLYLCFSRLNRGREELFAECARVLLENGADPNDYHIHPEYPEWPLPVLYGAAGVVFNPILTQLLLDSGANVNDNESLYHSTENRDHRCLEILLNAKPRFEKTNAVLRMLDYEDLEGIKILVAAGAPLNEEGKEGALNHAIRRGRGSAIIEFLLDSGADASRKSDEGWTPYRLAIRSSNPHAVDVLRKRGLGEEISAKDQFMIACMVGDADGARATGVKIEDLGPEELDAFVEAAWNGQTDVVRAMLEVGFPADHLSRHAGRTALHCACWKGDADTVELLLEHGAQVDVVETQYQALPIGWACHGSLNAKQGDGSPLDSRADYPRIVKALLEAGSAIPEYADGSAEVNEVIKAAR